MSGVKHFYIEKKLAIEIRGEGKILSDRKVFSLNNSFQTSLTTQGN